MKRLFVFLFGIFAYAVAVAQTETTKWYINGELYATTSCESGGNIDVPTPPENFGYNFAGWEPAIYDMSTLDATINGTSGTYNKAAYTWSVVFSYGTVYGESFCSPTSNIDISQTVGGGHCFCHVSGFAPIESDKIYEPVASPWLEADNRGSASNCAANCAQVCSSVVQGNYAIYRSELYGSN